MKRLLFFAICLTFLSACRRPNTQVSGKVLDYCTHAPFGGETVSLFTGDISLNHQSLVKSTTTLSDGSFDFDFHSGGFMDDMYWVECRGTYSKYLTKKITNNVDVLLMNRSLPTLNIKIKNISPYDNNDSIYIDFVCPNSLYPTFHYHFNYSGSTLNDSIPKTIDGCPPWLTNLSWTVTKNHVTTSFSNSITCTQTGTTDFLINY